MCPLTTHQEKVARFCWITFDLRNNLGKNNNKYYTTPIQANPSTWCSDILIDTLKYSDETTLLMAT